MVSCSGSLVQSCCGEGGALQTNVTGMCGDTHSVPATLGLSPLTGLCFPRLHCSGSRLLYMEWALHCVRFQCSGPPQKRGLGWACVLCLPRPSSSGRQEPGGRALPGAVRLSPSAVPASVSARASWVRLVSLLGSWSLAATLPADVNHPESQRVFG